MVYFIKNDQFLSPTFILHPFDFEVEIFDRKYIDHFCFFIGHRIRKSARNCGKGIENHRHKRRTRTIEYLDSSFELRKSLRLQGILFLI